MASGIFPGGSANAVKEWSLYLWKKSDKAIEIDYGFSVNDGNGKQVAYDRYESDGPNELEIEKELVDSCVH
jgi:N-acetyl-beta-hexosaminidase